MRSFSRYGLAFAGTFVTAIAMMASSAAAKVLLVGKYKGVDGQYATIQAAVKVAKPGDWILVGPGDYKTSSYEVPKGAGGDFPADVLVTRPDIFIRGMNRRSVIVDGTKPGTPVCSSAKSAQNFGPRNGKSTYGLEGIEVYEADNDWVQNLTVCNFIGGNGSYSGNGVWWNGGAGTGKIRGRGFVGSYLSATSTYFDKTEQRDATYGIFSSDWSGGVFDHDYASNFNDSGYYIGGCNDQCDQILENSQAQYNAIGYSGTNSGGPMLIEHNLFSDNQDGFDTNSQNNSDWPSPQDGACPKGIKPQVAGAPTCWILYKNTFEDNNNPNVPAEGAAAAGPVGTGASLEGRDDTVMDNKFINDDAWGVVFQPYPDFGTAPANVIKAGDNCHGGIVNYLLFGSQNVNCLYDDWGNALIGNTFTHDGSYGNPTNGDAAELTLTGGEPINCYRGNVDTDGTFTTSPADLETTNGTCGTVTPANSTGDGNDTFLFQAACDTNALGPGFCPQGTSYPRLTKVVMHKLPYLPSMPNPCSGVPRNAWCRAGKPVS